MLVFAASASATPTDLSMTKSVNPTTASPGDTVVYTMTAINSGPNAAHDVVLSDPMPAGVTFVDSSPGAPICSFAARTLTCRLGRVPANTTSTVTARATVDPISAPGDHQHLVPIEKVEQQVDLEPGQVRNTTLSCPGAGAIMADATVRVDAVDQGTGTLSSVVTRRARSNAVGGYEFTVANTAAGRAQTKVFGTCMPGTTLVESGHAHRVLIGDPVRTTATLDAGRREVRVPCGPGTLAVAPGIDVSAGAARLVRSEPDGTGRVFALEVSANGTTVELSVRCMSIRLDVTVGHSHDLRLTQIGRTVVVPAGHTVSESVVCADDAKGIVGSYDLGAGLQLAGHDPQPKSRVFKLFNPTAGPITARLGLLCVSDRTIGSGSSTSDEIVNMASLSSPTADPDLGDRGARATLTAVPGVSGSGTAAVDGETAKLIGGKGSVAVPLSCSDASCAGNVALVTAPGTAGVEAGKRLGGGTFRLDEGERSKWGVGLNRRASRLARRGKLRKLRATLTYADGERSSAVLRLR